MSMSVGRADDQPGKRTASLRAVYIDGGRPGRHLARLCQSVNSGGTEAEIKVFKGGERRTVNKP